MNKKKLVEILADFDDDIKVCVDEVECIYDNGEEKIVLKRRLRDVRG